MPFCKKGTKKVTYKVIRYWISHPSVLVGVGALLVDVVRVEVISLVDELEVTTAEEVAVVDTTEVLVLVLDVLEDELVRVEVLVELDKGASPGMHWSMALSAPIPQTNPISLELLLTIPVIPSLTIRPGRALRWPSVVNPATLLPQLTGTRRLSKRGSRKHGQRGGTGDEGLPTHSVGG